MEDREITRIPINVGPSATFVKIKLVAKDDHFEVYRDGTTYVGDIGEAKDLWKITVKPKNIVLYADNRSQAAEFACIIYSYIKHEQW